jgi:hypothetical protein
MRANGAIGIYYLFTAAEVEGVKRSAVRKFPIKYTVQCRATEVHTVGYALSLQWYLYKSYKNADAFLQKRIRSTRVKLNTFKSALRN